MQDGAIVHLTEDGTWKRKVPDDHVILRAHTPEFWRRRMFFLSRSKIFEQEGHYFEWSFDNNIVNRVLDGALKL